MKRRKQDEREEKEDTNATAAIIEPQDRERSIGRWRSPTLFHRKVSQADRARPRPQEDVTDKQLSY